MDLKVRGAKLEGAVSAEWTDADGDRYASEGDTITYTYNVGNAGNVALTGLSAPDASISQDALAVGGTVTATQGRVLTAAVIAAGGLDDVSFEAIATNGAKPVTATVTGGAPLLDLQAAQPETVPVLAVRNLEGQAAPFDLGTQDKYRNGQKVTLKGLDF